MYEQALSSYLALIKQRHEKWLRDRNMNLPCPEYRIDEGKRYDKIVEERPGAGGSVHSFIEKSTGDIFKPASWRAPAKHKRGSIYNNPENAFNPGDWMIRYL